MKSLQLHAVVTDDLHDGIKALAKAYGMSTSTLISEILTRAMWHPHLLPKPKPEVEVAVTRALQAWNLDCLHPSPLIPTGVQKWTRRSAA